MDSLQKWVSLSRSAPPVGAVMFANVEVTMLALVCHDSTGSNSLIPKFMKSSRRLFVHGTGVLRLTLQEREVPGRRRNASTRHAKLRNGQDSRPLTTATKLPVVSLPQAGPAEPALSTQLQWLVHPSLPRTLPRISSPLQTLRGLGQT